MNAPLASHDTPSPDTHSIAAPAADEFDAVLKGGAWAILPQFGVIDANGDDAASFLHSQLTNDIQHLDVTGARLAGYCSPKGRLLASFVTWRPAPD